MGRDTDPLYCLEQEDRILATGKEVIVYWNQNGFSYQGRAKIATLRDKCVTVELIEPAGHQGEYSPGYKFDVPRYSDYTKWSSTYCVRMPIKDHFVHKDFR